MAIKTYKKKQSPDEEPQQGTTPGDKSKEEPSPVYKYKKEEAPGDKYKRESAPVDKYKKEGNPGDKSKEERTSDDKSEEWKDTAKNIAIDVKIEVNIGGVDSARVRMRKTNLDKEPKEGTTPGDKSKKRTSDGKSKEWKETAKKVAIGVAIGVGIGLAVGAAVVVFGPPAGVAVGTKAKVLLAAGAGGTKVKTVATFAAASAAAVGVMKVFQSRPHEA